MLSGVMDLLATIYANMTMTTKIQLATVWGSIFTILIAAWWKRSYQNAHRTHSEHGTARFATRRDIKRMGLLSRNGPVLGLTQDKRYLTYNDQGHIAVIARTRGGKGVGVIVPTLLSYPNSVVVVDMKGENWNITSGWRSTFSKCYRFSPTLQQSNKFNPVDCVRRGAQQVGDAQMIASVICGMDSDKLEMPHWQDTAWSLLTTTLLYVVEHYQDKSLSGMLKVLNNPRMPIRDVLQRMLKSPHQVIQLGARNLLNKHDNELSSVVSTASRHLVLYSDPIVAANTSQSDFTIEQLMRNSSPLSVYLALPPPDLERTATLFRLMICLITKRLTETIDNQANRFPLLLIYDEFAAFGRIEYFEKALSYIAGYGIKAMLVAQGINQVRAVYGHNTSVLDQCECKVMMTPNDLITAGEISRMLGQRTIHQWRKSYSRSFKAFLPGTPSVSEGSFGRPLMMPDEVMTMPLDEELVTITGKPPVKAKRIMYYSDPFFAPRAYMKQPAIQTISLAKSEDDSEPDSGLEDKAPIRLIKRDSTL